MLGPSLLLGRCRQILTITPHIFVQPRHRLLQTFVGVIVERVVPGSPGAVNWAVRGVRYGKANRELCGAALSNCVSEKQLEFELSE